MPKKHEASDGLEARLAASTTIPDPQPEARSGPASTAPAGPVASPSGQGGEGVAAARGAEEADGLSARNLHDKGGSLPTPHLENSTTPKEGSGASLSFDTKEKSVRRGFGLSEDAIRELRQQYLVQGVDWDYKKRAVCYSPRGVETLRAAIARASQKNGAAPSTPPTAQLEPVKEKLPVTLIVWKAKLPNRKLIFAHMPGADADNKPEARFRVKVRHPEKFIKGMEIPCRPLDESGTLYELACAEPRRKGRLPT